MVRRKAEGIRCILVGFFLSRIVCEQCGTTSTQIRYVRHQARLLVISPLSFILGFLVCSIVFYAPCLRCI